MEPTKKNPINKLTQIAQSSPNTIAIFDNDPSFVFICKKTERLTSALYLVTNLFSESEPMKWNLRKKGSVFLSVIFGFKDTPIGSKTKLTYNARIKIFEIISLLEISFQAGLVSEMNFSILKEEFSNLVDSLDISNTSFIGLPGERLSLAFFENSESNRESDKVRPEDIKDNRIISDKGGFKKSNRQNIILGLLKKKKELTIKDIALVIRDCSEKTIQRELTSFISAGVLKRTGERRWSKYSLA